MTFAKDIQITGKLLTVMLGLVTLLSAGVGALSATFAAGKSEGIRAEVDRARDGRIANVEAAVKDMRDMQQNVEALIRLNCITLSPELVRAARLPCEYIRQ